MKQIKIAVVDDSKAYLKIMNILLTNLGEDRNVDLNLNFFASPLEYKINNSTFDIVILDYIFYQFPSNLNGFNLDKTTKIKNSSTKVIINTSYENEEILHLANEYKDFIDKMSNKEESSGNELDIVNKVSNLIDEILEIENKIKW